MSDADPDAIASPPSDTSDANTTSSTTTVESGLHNGRMCECQCDPLCNCLCPCLDHCICLSKHGDNHTCNKECNKEGGEGGKDCKYKCKRECGSRNGYRNLVVCLDGTSNQFGHRNTNVVELHNRILKDDPDVPQLTFYSSGIGTYVPPSRLTIAHWLHNFDKAFAWSFKRLVEEAYRWIADHYQPGDRLFLFGFSRGAYQVRALAGMIEKLGLVFSGNKGLIPFAYELYSDRHKGIKIKGEAEAEALALNFKRTFARPVKVHFVGVWDTVSSVGIAQTQPLPLTKSASHICFFRHGLALDERRVKFLPEYLGGGRSPLAGNEHYDEEPPNAKEVWFPGRHSDIGGSCQRGHTIDLSRVPLLWMENEAGAAGLKLASRRGGVEWRWDDHHGDTPKNTLSWFWWLIEFLPLRHLRYNDKESTTRIPHLGRGRLIVPSQLIHASLAFKQNYTPSAVFFGTTKAAWKPLIGIGNVEDLSWADEWEDFLEMDLFDHSVAQDAMRELQSLRSNHADKRDTVRQVVLLKRLSFMALSRQGSHKISEIIKDFVAMLSDEDDKITAGSASCLFQLAKHWHHRQILENSDVVQCLKSMLHGQSEGARLASIQCLSQLILKPENGDKHEADQTNVHRDDTEPWEKHLSEARDILSERPLDIWIQTIGNLFDTKDKSKETLGTSCISRLVKIVSIRDEFLKYDGLPPSGKFIERLVRLLEKQHAQAHAASSLGSMAACLKDGIAPHRSRMVSYLMLMIQHKNSKSKGAGVACLSEYFVNDGEMRKLILQRESNLFVDLMASLFGEHNHCHYNDKSAVVKAFTSIATHSGSSTQLNQRRVIQVLVQTLCVDRWLNVDECVTLLQKINSGDSRMEMINEFIEALVTIGTNGDSLYRTQCFFHAIYGPVNIFEANPVLAPDASVMKTIVKAMAYPHSRMKAVEFLKSVAMRAEIYPIMREIRLLEKIIELGDGDDYDALFSVRTALEDFIWPDGPFVELLLKPNAFAILTKSIDWNVADAFREGHNLRQNVKAQEPGVRCIQKLIMIDKARMMLFDEQIVDKLLNIFAAFKDEPESGERLRLYSPKYDDLLMKTLSRLVTFDDSRKRIHDNKDLQEKLRRFITVPGPDPVQVP